MTEESTMTSSTEPAVEVPLASTSKTLETQPLSKNARKKLERAARIAEQKKERRAYEKEKRKEKKRQLAEKRAAGEIDEGEDAERMKKRARTEGPRKPFQARVVVDLGFDDMMTENEVKSLTSQLAYTYSANRKASQPFSTILFTSLNGKTHTRLEGLGHAAHKRWHDTEWWAEGYENLWASEGLSGVESENTSDSAVSPDKIGTDAQVLIAGDLASVRSQAAEVGEERDAEPSERLSMKPQQAPRDTVVYLTADASNELMELKEGETYIIGGICDHNRYKNLCFNKSKDSQIRSAKLPIGTYLAELRTRKVLTVNQTFEILLKWVETRDWRQAFEIVVPKRKLREAGNGNTSGAAVDATAGAEATLGDDTIILDAAALEADDAEDDIEGDVDTAGAVIAIAAATSDLTTTRNNLSPLSSDVEIRADVLTEVLNEP